MKRALLILVVATRAIAQPADPSSALREANAAATAGDWARVDVLVQPLLGTQLERADLAEAHRLAGIAALFAQPPRHDLAEQHFLQYLRIDLDAHLDPALYPPEVVNFFNDVRARHAAELKALRPQSKRYFVLTLAPPFGQFQNGDRVKGWIIGGLLAALIGTNVGTYVMLRSWCTPKSGDGGTRPVCDETSNHVSGAQAARVANIVSGVALISTYIYGVWDGVRGYRRETRERAMLPYATSTTGGALVGIRMNF